MRELLLDLLGEAVQVGTRFVVAKESNAHPNYKAKILKARDIDTTISAQYFIMCSCHQKPIDSETSSKLK